VNATFKRR